MKEFTIYYKSTEGTGLFVGEGFGETKENAANDFLSWHGKECIEIVEIVEYK